MTSQKERARVEEVINDASGKIYLPPCQIACPLGEDIQRTNAMISLLPLDIKEASSGIIRIGDEIYDKNPLFPLCSYICGLCEKQCNYKSKTGAVRRRMLKRFLNDYYLPYLETKSSLPLPTKEKVVVIGGGPTGLTCAYMLSKRGYRVTILEGSSQLGGALRYIPQYRLPRNVIDITIDSLIRIAHIEVKFGVRMGASSKTLADLKDEGYQAVFIATGTPNSRLLTIEGKRVSGEELDGVTFGLNLLSDANQGKLSPQLFQRKRVIVVGGGNVAFDVARTARRLGGDVAIVCLECEDKSSRDGIPADIEEIKGAREEGIRIIYSRGVEEIIGENGKFKKIKCPQCTAVFDETGLFNPKFNHDDVTYLDGDVLFVTIGQAPERGFYQQEGLLDERGRLDVERLTLMSNRKGGVFIGGDVKRVGFAAEAMRDGVIVAESIDRYIKGGDLKAGRGKEYEPAAIPERQDYKPQPELVWVPADERLNFEPFEKGFTLEQAVEEAKRCLYCGPCKSCKACVALEFQPNIPEIKLNEDLCIRCGNCVFYCPYNAAKLESPGKVRFDLNACHGCGLCVAMCPAIALDLENWERERISALISQLVPEMEPPKILGFRCQWATFPMLNNKSSPNLGYIDLPCAARVDEFHILEAFQKGVSGVLIVACSEKDCHRGTGSHWAQHTVAKLKKKLVEVGLQDRLHFCTVSSGRSEEFENELAKFYQSMEAVASKESG